jgi:hypothetical protein
MHVYRHNEERPVDDSSQACGPCGSLRVLQDVLVELGEGGELLLLDEVELVDEEEEVAVARVDVRCAGSAAPQDDRRDDAPSMERAQSWAKWWL